MFDIDNLSANPAGQLHPKSVTLTDDFKILSLTRPLGRSMFPRNDSSSCGVARYGMEWDRDCGGGIELKTVSRHG
jgi:hypothetical protein